MEFSSRGLIKNGNSYAKSWEDLFSYFKKTTKDQKKKFKTKYKNSIKQITFKSNGRTYTYMVASQELAKNKTESDLQKIARGCKEIEVKTNFKVTVESRMKAIIKQIFAILSDMILYQWDGKYELIDGMVIEVQETGEVIYDNCKITSLIKDSIKSGCIQPDDIAWSLLLHIKSKIDKIIIGVHTNRYEETYYQFTKI